MNNQSKPALSAITIRNTLLPGDLGYIAAIHGERYASECGYGLNFEAYVLKGLGEFAEQYDGVKDQVWVCEHDGLIIGCLMAQHRPDALQLRYFIFLPAYRGIGLGNQLMTQFLAFMQASGQKTAYLWTTDEQRSAVALYEKYGFVLVEEKPSDAFGKALTERKYRLNLDV